MIKNYLLITLRNLMKNKFYIFINILGMGIAIASCIVAFFNYDFNAKFDENHVQTPSIYRINSEREFQSEITAYGIIPLPLAEAIRQNVKDIEAISRYIPGGRNLRIGDNLFNTDVDFVDPEFFQIFTFEFVAGSPEGLREKNKILISEELARKFFGDQPALGKTITEPNDSLNREYEVGGIFKEQPRNSSFGNQAFLNYQTTIDQEPELENGTNWKFRATAFALVKNPQRISAIETQLEPYKENNNRVREDFIIKKFALDPFTGMAVRDMIDERPGTWTREAVPISAVIGTAMMGGFVLLIACFNLTNTAIAVSSRRLKEIGIRKVVGGIRAGIILQFLGETMLICFVALLLGVLLAESLLIPAFNDMWPFLKITSDYTGNPGFVFFLIGVLVFTGLLAGSYPAFYISRFNPVSILKGTVKFGGTNLFTLVLLVLQFGISLMAVVSSISFIQNAQYQKEFDLGFRKNVVYTWLDNYAQFETYRNELEKNPDIKTVAGSAHHIMVNYFNDPVKHKGSEVEVDIMDIGDEYLQTTGMQLTRGRYFQKDSETDHKESVIITENLASAFGMTDPVGQEITWLDTARYYVVGVVKNIYNRGLWRPNEPVLFRYANKDQYRHLLVSADAGNIIETNKFMEETWKRVFPNKQYTGNYMDEELAEAARVNNNILKMFVFLGVVAMMLSATGLFTLVSLNIIRRMKEIGVRKVLGASVANIAAVTNKTFALILVVSAVFGSVMGAYMTDMLMGSIWEFYTSANALTFVVSIIVLFFISAVTIGYKVYATSVMSPVTTLRTE
jgi:putative ABC transport system permease protein